MDPFKRVVAWILHYKGKLCRQSKLHKQYEKINFQSSKGEIAPLTVCELRDTKEVIVKYVQKQSFKEEMQTLRCITEETRDKKIAVKKYSNIYKFDPFMKNGFIRVEDTSTMHQSRSMQDTPLFSQRSITLSTSLLIAIIKLLDTQESNTPYRYSDKATG